jgi:hypothetical protein
MMHASQLLMISNTMNFHGAAKVQSLVFCIQLTQITDELSYQQMNGEVRARPRRRTGVAGGAGADKARTNKGARPPQLSPRRG